MNQHCKSELYEKSVQKKSKEKRKRRAGRQSSSLITEETNEAPVNLQGGRAVYHFRGNLLLPLMGRRDVDGED